MNQIIADELRLTDSQIKEIIKIIQYQCNLIAQREKDNFKKYPELYDEDYMQGRRQSYTSAVLAGFKENTYIPDMTIVKKKYGTLHYQPELSSDTAVVQLYGENATLNIKEIKRNCELYNISSSSKKFYVFQFFLLKDRHLRKVDLIEFDANAKEIMRHNVFEWKANVIEMPA